MEKKTLRLAKVGTTSKHEVIFNVVEQSHFGIDFGKRSQIFHHNGFALKSTGNTNYLEGYMLFVNVKDDTVVSCTEEEYEHIEEAVAWYNAYFDGKDYIPFHEKAEFNNDKKVSDAFNVLKNAIKEDDEYAYGWHANIAMSCHDANTSTQPHKQSLDAANNAASKFMKLCFGVETSQYMLRNKSSSD